jgi:hypothetical protein
MIKKDKVMEGEKLRVMIIVEAGVDSARPNSSKFMKHVITNEKNHVRLVEMKAIDQ